ncbi:MAG: ubiquinol oxidase subunit II [Candidatus Saccharibacteria bacterium]
MNKKYSISLIIVIAATVASLATIYFRHHTVAVLQPRGPIALQERNLMLTAFGLMLIVVIPVFVITFFIVYKYREGHHGKYKPDFDHSNLLESIWWLIPTILIVVLSVITWHGTYKLNPYNKIASKQPNLNIEVVALDWKWLFIYPNQNVASVNSLVIPVNTPVTFYITADAPMNSFWIPQLGGQIYAMPGMDTQLNLMATSPGNYYGSSANISGTGFAGMHFDTHAVDTTSFNSWVSSANKAKVSLTSDEYNKLDQPSINNAVSYYSKPDPNLYTSIINKYMAPGAQANMMMEMD